MAWRLLNEDPTNRQVLLSDALGAYLSKHKKGHQKTFAQHKHRAINQVIEAVGDLPLQSYRRHHAHKVVDHLRAQGVKTGTVKRRLNDIKAIFNKGRLECDLQTVPNPFERLDIPGEGEDATKREAFTVAELRQIADACVATNDDIRHIAAIQADTGLRLSEALGLRIEDVVLERHPS